MAIAGHRTTYGKPFNQIDRLKPGDALILETPIGTCTYQVAKAPFVDKLDCAHGLIGMDIIREWRDLSFEPAKSARRIGKLPRNGLGRMSRFAASRRALRCRKCGGRSRSCRRISGQP